MPRSPGFMYVGKIRSKYFSQETQAEYPDGRHRNRCCHALLVRLDVCEEFAVISELDFDGKSECSDVFFTGINWFRYQHLSPEQRKKGYRSWFHHWMLCVNFRRQ